MIIHDRLLQFSRTLWSKDKDLRSDPRTRTVNWSSRTRTFLEDNNTKLSELFRAVLCIAVVYMHIHTLSLSSMYSGHRNEFILFRPIKIVGLETDDALLCK